MTWLNRDESPREHENPITHDLYLDYPESMAFCEFTYKKCCPHAGKQFQSYSHDETWSKQESFTEFMEEKNYEGAMFHGFITKLFCDDVHGVEFRPKSPVAEPVKSHYGHLAKLLKDARKRQDDAMKEFLGLLKDDVEFRPTDKGVFAGIENNGYIPDIPHLDKVKPEHMNFSQALEAVRDGKQVRRVFWLDEKPSFYSMSLLSEISLPDLSAQDWYIVK